MVIELATIALDCVRFGRIDKAETNSAAIHRHGIVQSHLWLEPLLLGNQVELIVGIRPVDEDFVCVLPH